MGELEVTRKVPRGQSDPNRVTSRASPLVDKDLL